MLDGLHQLVGIDGLGQHRHAFALGQIAGLGGGDDDDGNGPGAGVRAQLAQHVAAAEARKSQIEHDGVRRLELYATESVDTVADSGDDEAGMTERGAVHLARRSVIFDEEDHFGGESRGHAPL